MTARCTGGTSAAQPQYTAVVDVTVQMIAAVLSARGLPWIIPAIPLLNIPPLTLASFCSTDPPSMPTLTTAEVTALLQLQFGTDFTSGLSKLSDAVLNIIWDQLCYCSSGTLTAPPALAQPANTPVPVPPSPGTGVACQSFGPLSHPFTNGNGTFNRSGLAITSGLVSRVRITIQNQVTSGAGWTLSTTPRFALIAGGQTNLPTFFTPPNTTSVMDYVFPQNNTANSFEITTNAVTGTGSLNEIKTWEAFCGSTVPGPLMPCCPPDAATAAQLDLILRMVTLIQRQAAPFAYVYGTNHTTLSGDGALDVSGLIGVSVDVTTLPSSYGSAAGTPVELFGLGWVTLGTADGYETSRHIDHDGTLFLPPGAGAYTKIGYSLSPGVVVSIRELVREP